MLEKMTFLSAAENRASFFKRIETIFPKSDPRSRAIERAYNMAKDAFRGISRKGGGRYFEHLRAVALILIDWLRVKDYEIIVAALLHDIVEDIPSWDVKRVEREFGHKVAFLVDWMTKPPAIDISKKEAERIYHNNFKRAPREFFLIKLADRLHNLTTMWSYSLERRIRKINETKRYYLPYAERELILLHELEEAIENLEKINKPVKGE